MEWNRTELIAGFVVLVILALIFMSLLVLLLIRLYAKAKTPVTSERDEDPVMPSNALRNNSLLMKMPVNKGMGISQFIKRPET